MNHVNQTPQRFSNFADMMNDPKVELETPVQHQKSPIEMVNQEDNSFFRRRVQTTKPQKRMP